MIFYTNNKSDEKFIINNNTRDVSVSVYDLKSLFFFSKEILKGKLKNFNRDERRTKTIKLKNNGLVYKLEIASLEISNSLPSYDENEFIISLLIDQASEQYLNIGLNKYGMEQIKSHIEEEDYSRLNLEISSTKNHLISKIADDIEVSVDLQSNYGKDKLIRWKNYYEILLSDLAGAVEEVVAEVDLKEFRENIDFWENIAESDQIYLPVKIKQTRNLKSTYLIAQQPMLTKKENQEEYNLSDEHIFDGNKNVECKYIRGERKKEIFHRAAIDFDYEINSDIVVLQSDEDIEWALKKLTNKNFTSIIIRENIVGQIELVRRVILGLDSVLNNEVCNPELIENVLDDDYMLDSDTYIPDEKNIKELKKRYQKLNDEQALVVDKIMNMDNFFLVQGPPGTGKTEIISTVVKELNALNKRILITSNVHVARTNIIERIKGEKELIIKSFTTIRADDPKYNQEKSKNKINYLQNQVLEKFKYDNKLIDSDSLFVELKELYSFYEQKLNELALLESRKIEIETSLKNMDFQLNELETLKTKLDDELEKNIELIVKSPNNNMKFANKEVNLKFSRLYENELDDAVTKYFYAQKMYQKFKQQKTISDRIDYLLNYDLSKSQIKDIDGLNYLKEYKNTNKLKKLLFNKFNLFSLVKISGLTKKDYLKLLEKNSVLLSQYDTNEISNNAKTVFSSLKEHLNSNIKNIKSEIDYLNIKLLSLSEEIVISQKQNYHVLSKKEELSTFLNEYNSIKNMYKDDSLFYSYLSEISQLNNDVTSSEYDASFQEIMLGDSSFDRLFKCEDNGDGFILSMSTSQVAKLLKTTEINFDYIIVDEASKCNIADLIVSLPRTSKLILLGDYLQLDPVFDSKIPVDFLNQADWTTLNKSNFSQLIKKEVDIRFENGNNNFDNSPIIGVLKKQYRMGKDIFDLVKSIYDAIPGFELVDGKKEFVNPFLNYSNILSIQCDGIEKKEEDESSSYNEKEIEVIGNILDCLIRLKKENKIQISSVGLISFYRKQITKLNNSILTKKSKLKELGISVSLGTVDNFQGKEFDLVILSFVRTERITGWIEDIRRINVAISRAKDKLITVGNFEKLNSIAMTSSLNKNSSQSEVERAVVYETIIPTLYEKTSQFNARSYIDNEIDMFLIGGENKGE